jgi:hypothetical protein
MAGWPGGALVAGRHLYLVKHWLALSRGPVVLGSLVALVSNTCCCRPWPGDVGALGLGHHCRVRVMAVAGRGQGTWGGEWTGFSSRAHVPWLGQGRGGGT